MGNNSSKASCVVCGHRDYKDYFYERKSGYKCPDCVGTPSKSKTSSGYSGPDGKCTSCGEVIHGDYCPNGHYKKFF